MSSDSPRIERETQTVAAMILLYCRNKHGGRTVCAECRALTDYALERLRKCPSGEGKTVCSLCTVHCYKPEMRERIRDVMRYSGPRMISRHPVMAVMHLIDKRRKTPFKPPLSHPSERTG